MRWRLGADLGTNSLGWAVIRLDDQGAPEGVEAAGSRIFSDGREPKSGASLAGGRRDARAMRRRRDRFKQRQAALLKYLTLAGFFPADDEARRALAALDPYELRTRALDEALPPAHLGRALFHLNQRRGFKSNRKTDRGRNDDAGMIRIGVARLHEQMAQADARTFGEFLHKRRAGTADPNAIPHVRTRIVAPDAEAGKAGEVYDFYPDRQTLEEEFAAIWQAQALHHPAVLTPERREQFYEIIFHQRPLREPKIGFCTLLPPEPRLPKAHPLFQRRRLLEELNALRIVLPGAEARPLDRPQRDALLSKLGQRKTVTYESLRKALKLDPDARFNKESENRKEMKGDEVAAEMAHKSRLGPAWLGIKPEAQWPVIERLLTLESDAEITEFEDWLQQTHGLSGEQAANVTSARLPEGYGRFGETATKALIAELEKEVVVYSEAVQRAGLGHHSDLRDGRIWQDDKGNPALPYYGAVLERHILPGTADPDEQDEALRTGRLTNPTVHIGLNQLRRVVNALIRRFGPPQEIAIELARELKLDEERKREINVENRKNREAAEQRSRKLQEIGQADKGGNRAQLKLWEELNRDNVLDRRCVYSGRQISLDMLFSGAVEIDHILPFSATLDDSNGNRILCLREVNRIKRKRTPFEARADLRAHFGPDADWEAIAARAARLPREKRWRFEPEALGRFDAQGGFLARHLIDTQHLSRLAREYLSALYPETGEGSSHVWVSPGRLTEMLRRNWGLNHHLPDHNLAGGASQPKNRRDHRHHAIDAIVVAVTDRAMLNRIAREAGSQGHEAADRLVAGIPDPWQGFSEAVGEAVRAITVSHRPDHGSASKAGRPANRDTTAGRLHNETAYGLTGEKDARGLDIVVTRKPLSAFKKPADLDAIRDEDLKQKLKDWTAGREGAAFEQAMRSFGHPERGPRSYPGLRRIRVVEPLSVIPIRDRDGRAYKAYKGDSNYRFDVWELKTGKWKDEVVSMFEAHQPGWSSPIRADNPTARKVLSLQQNDVVAIERDGERELMRVVKFSAGSLVLAPPQEAGSLKARDADKNDPFRYVYGSPSSLQRWKARQVRIDELGRIHDPGFPARKPRPKG
ncbi:type II CRISPR RNA-guided endonuclease Cas9 [Bosea sp. (in: a-proteobacteria)]|uniref:type II CRISPR RNA-guided endonuclease Cas9 n=1 Tax=Bosea sp. (in: a-proteobacteria) TaxID=1871050 RepID=UPI001AC2EBC3|nr:type II CRISPR RNA-guided endonuclease Cas9 [Bosea sp. (in: a-proteobacteria)]MBN9439781.1 type II CRISPR RNA-guided endonuclease Cas9 [Bosea sp. (in: a-proteobacteria)]